MAPDAPDRRTLRALQRDGRLSIVALAEEVGLSAPPRQRRVKRLEEAGVIQGYAARVEAPRVGLPLQAFVRVRLEGHGEDPAERFHKALAALPEVIAAYTLSGETDHLPQELAPDMEAFGEFAARRLLRLPGVKATRTSFVPATLKPPGEVPV